MEVVCRDLVKRFGSVTAVDRLSLRVREGEFLVLLGPSGCGKTSTLRMIAGLEIPDAGKIEIGDREVTDLPPRDRNVAMVFQNYALYPHMNVRRNLAFDLGVRGVSAAEIVTRVQSVGEMLGIVHLMERNPAQLSGGEQQRVALGRAIVREPDVFLMDEPLSNLDAKLRVHMRAELKKLHRRLRRTTIYVTHDQEEAMTVADTVAVLKDGELQQRGAPREIYDSPQNRFVAYFVGSPSMNFFEGDLVTQGGEIEFASASFSHPLPSPIAIRLKKRRAQRKVVMGIRPEHVCLHQEAGREVLSAVVDVLEPLARELHVQLMLGDDPVTIITDPSRELKVGQKVGLNLPIERCYFFDRDSGRNLERDWDQ